ncbi:LPXTG cell wall anchor domain-containing protein [uncultured Limosilactobacillus sp.]|nr:LPXTG cell wall anchor domain-containing protein [uncultured Limosilactobacillus sp.]
MPGQGNTANRKATLPQTGNDTNRLAIASLAAASLLGLFGLGKRDRKKN